MKSLLPWTARTLAFVALCLSAYLTWISATTATAIGCDFAAFDCDAALASPWAKWLGVPVAAGGLLCYGLALAGALLAGRAGSLGSIGWRLLEIATPLAVGAGLWFTFIQATALESFCLYCMATHGCGVLMAASVLAWRYASGDGDVPMPAIGLSPLTAADETSTPPRLGIPTALGIVGIVVLAIGQVAWAPATMVVSDDVHLESPVSLSAEDNLEEESTGSEQVTTAKPIVESPQPIDRYPRIPNGSRKISLLKNQLTIDAYDHAVIGSPEAPHLVVEMMDYACPHCREFHDTLTEAVERFEGQIGIVIMPIPGEILCNPYVTKARKKSAGACYAAKLSIAVSMLSPDEFESFHEWMLEADEIPRRTASLIEARRVVDADALSKRLRDSDGTLSRKIKQYVELAAALGRNNRFGLPAQILGDRFIAGTPKTIDDLCKAWADAFGLETPGEEIPF